MDEKQFGKDTRMNIEGYMECLIYTKNSFVESLIKLEKEGKITKEEMEGIFIKAGKIFNEEFPHLLP